MKTKNKAHNSSPFAMSVQGRRQGGGQGPGPPYGPQISIGNLNFD